MHLKDELIDCASLWGKFTPVAYRHRPCNYARLASRIELFVQWDILSDA